MVAVSLCWVVVRVSLLVVVRVSLVMRRGEMVVMVLLLVVKVLLLVVRVSVEVRVAPLLVTVSLWGGDKAGRVPSQ